SAADPERLPCREAPRGDATDLPAPCGAEPSRAGGVRAGRHHSGDGALSHQRERVSVVRAAPATSTLPEPSPVTRQIVLPTSSAPSSEPSCPIATPTGRP